MLHRFMKYAPIVCMAMYIGATVPGLQASDQDAITISTNIQQRHMPYGTILDPVFASADPASPDYSQVVSYARAGDSAIWTGHYLAAEAFRYHATHDPDALNNVRGALQGIRSLLDVTGSGVLARCLIPVDAPFAAAIQEAEINHGIFFGTYQGQPYFWIGETSRDQYSGVMFGLSVAYDMVDDDSSVRDFIRTDVTRILNYLLSHAWNVVMPDGSISTTFVIRPDQQLSLLQVGRRINPQRFSFIYGLYRAFYAGSVGIPIAYDNIDDHNHYFKFNLNYINLFNLIRLEEPGFYRQMYMNAYNSLRTRTELHGNPHFNMIDRVLHGPDAARDSETMSLLDLSLQRSNRDYWVDLRGKYPACGDEDRACDPIPVNERVNTDFLWQRSPFLLFGGGSGVIETAAIDYILPYWMARAFEVF